jgi:hypothetical protein
VVGRTYPTRNLAATTRLSEDLQEPEDADSIQDDPTGTGGPGARWWRNQATRLGALAAPVVSYLVIALGANAPTWAHGAAHTIQGGSGSDAGEEVWFLASTPWALLHGVNPFFNSFLAYPHGVNLMDNTLMPLLGLLALPLTVPGGAVLTYNVLMVLAPAASATAAFFVFRRWCRWDPAAFVGGLIYGFSPFMVATGHQHLFLTSAFVSPLVLLLMDRIVVRNDGSPFRNGLLLGFVLLAQLLISSEIFSSMVVMMAVGVVIVFLSRRGRAGPKGWGYLLRSGGSALLPLVLLGGYPIWMAAAGPQHITGPAQPITLVEGISTDLLTPFLPTVNQALTFGHGWVGTNLVAEHGATLVPAAAENGGYVGIPLLAALIVGVVLLHRRRIVRLAALMAACAFLLSMGARLHVDGHFTAIRLPFTLLAHLPLFDSEIAERYTEFLWLFIGLLVAVMLEEARHAGLALNPVRRGFMLLAPLALVLAPLIPSWPYGAQSVAVPQWFRSPAVRHVPEGSVLLTYPFPDVATAEPMVWQAVANMRFRMPGGYLITPAQGGRATFLGGVDTLAAQVLIGCWNGGTENLGSATETALRQELLNWRVATIVVPINQPHASCATGVFKTLVGRPTRQYGSEVWADASKMMARR